MFDEGSGEAQLIVDSLRLVCLLFQLDDNQSKALQETLSKGPLTWSSWDVTQNESVEHQLLLQTCIFNSCLYRPLIVLCTQICKVPNSKHKVRLRAVDFEEVEYQTESYKLIKHINM